MDGGQESGTETKDQSEVIIIKIVRFLSFFLRILLGRFISPPPSQFAARRLPLRLFFHLSNPKHFIPSNQLQPHHHIFPNVELLMFSSSKSHTPTPNEDFDVPVAPLTVLSTTVVGTFLSTTTVEAGTEAAAEEVEGKGPSTSTTRSTAFPSNTRLTLSVSQAEPKPTQGPEELYTDEGEEVETPVNASKNALPSFFKIVCDAIAANIACTCYCRCCSFSFCWFSLLARPFACNRGEAGGVGYPAAACLLL